MAYSRYRRKPRRSYAKSGRKSRSARPSRYTAKTRVSRRTTIRRPTKRRMIDMMSTKKRDTMIQRATGGSNPAPDAPTSVGQNITLLANSVTNTGIHQLIFCPTYRFLQPSNAEYLSMRTAQKVFVKGYLETFTFVPNDGSTWWWRRILFNYKAPIGSGATMAQYGAQPDATSTTYRYLRDLSGQTTGPWADARISVNDIVFKGTLNVDWGDPFTAPTDKSRVTVVSDTKRTISSGNALARPQVVKRYTPINKSLRYDDDENGLQITPSPLSVQTKEGMGNLYVLDMFYCPSPQDASTSLRLGVNSTLYWHEK